MANTNAPFGLRPVNSPQGSVKKTWYTVKAGTTKIHMGTPVKMDAAGTVDIGATTGNLLGPALAFKDDDGIPQGYYPGDSSTSWEVLVADDPEQEFEIQEDSDGGALAATDVGLNACIIDGTGDDDTGLSAYALDSSTAATTNTLQYRIVRPSPNIKNAIGDYCKWIVRPNAHFYNQTTGI